MVQDFRSKLVHEFQETLRLPVGHYSANGYWGTRLIIEQQERIHWFLGLRQAELEVLAREQALAYNRRVFRAMGRSLAAKKRRLRLLGWLSWAAILWPSILEEREDLEHEIAEAEVEQQRGEPLLRDALFELEVAIQHRDRIQAEHQAELEGKSFEHLQETHTPVAALEGTARMIAAKVWASQMGLPSEVGVAIADLSPAQRQIVMQREAEIRLGIQTQAAIAQSHTVLAHLPTEQRNTILLVAAQLVEQQNLLPLTTTPLPPNSLAHEQT